MAKKKTSKSGLMIVISPGKGKGKRDATGPRAKAGICPKMKKNK